MRGAHPTGVVTLPFTDVEGSTKLLHELGDGCAVALRKHRRVLRAAFTARDGIEVDTRATPSSSTAHITLADFFAGSPVVCFVSESRGPAASKPAELGCWALWAVRAQQVRAERILG